MLNRDNDFIYGSLIFIQENIIEILMVSIVFFLIISYMILNKVTFPSDNAQVKKVVVMETMQNNEINKLEKKNLAKNIIKSSACEWPSKVDSGSNLDELLEKQDNTCKSYVKTAGPSTKDKMENCTASSCCVWVNGKKGNKQNGECLHGDKNGPTRQPLFKVDEYYFNGKKHKPLL